MVVESFGVTNDVSDFNLVIFLIIMFKQITYVYKSSNELNILIFYSFKVEIKLIINKMNNIFHSL